MSDQASKGYEFFDHTADVGLRSYGASLDELFVNSAKGLYELLVEDSVVIQRNTREIFIEADNTSELLRLWLKELLFWFHSDRFLGCDYEFESISDNELSGRVVGESFNPSRHSQGIEVKGVTLHQLNVEKLPSGYKASVIFDV